MIDSILSIKRGCLIYIIIISEESVLKVFKLRRALYYLLLSDILWLTSITYDLTP